MKVEGEVGVVGEEDCTDARMDEVYRPPRLSIKTEHEVSFVISCFCGVCVCLCCSMFCFVGTFYMCKTAILSSVW